MIKNDMQNKPKSTKLPCRRESEDRRGNSKLMAFPMVDGNGANINRDRRTSPDRRYDVEIQWLRG